MALVVDDRIKETTTTINTGSYSLAGAVTGFQTFSDGVGDGNTTYYCCTDGSDYEIGLGTLSGTTLARTTIIESSNSNSAVSWSAGSKDIFCTLPASKALIKDASNHVKFADTEKLIFGDGNDAEIYHSGAHTYIQNNGTGNLYIRDQGSGDLKLEGSTYITLQSATNENYLVATANGAVTLYYDALGKVATTASGIEVFGSTVDNGATHDGDVTFTGTSYNAVWDKSQNALQFFDNAKAFFGSGSDLQISHNATNSFIDNTTGNLYIRQFADDANVFIQSDNGSGGWTNYFAADGSSGEAQLFHYGSEKLATQSGGIDVTGDITVSGTVDGRDVATDGTKLDGIETNADVTDATNVQAAGALMDSELTSEASVKAIDQGLATTDSPTFAGLTSNGDIVFEGATADDFETTVTVTDPTADRTITLPDQTGTAMLWQNKWPDDPVTTGGYAFRNYAIGENTLSSITSGYANVVYGREAGTSLTTGYRNTAIGEDAFGDASSASNSTAVGERALQQITTGGPNTGFGVAALLDNRSGTNNTAIGYGSGRGVTTYGITTVGNEAGNIYTSGTKWFQTLIGNFCGDDTLGDRSTGLGAFAISDGYHVDSVAVGYDALGQSSTASPYYNVAVGNFAGDGIWAGDNNVVVGYASDIQASTSNGAVAIGSSAIAPTYGVSIGYLAGNSYASGSLYNVLVGYRAGRDMDGGDYCTFVGYDAGEQGGTGDRNTGLGATSLDALTTGANNSAVGMNSLSGLTEGSRNCALGEGTGYSLSTGSNNTFLGYQAGYQQGGSTTNALTTGSNVTCLGYEAMPSSATATNEITLGDNNISTLRCNVQTISSLSDERDKTAISDIPYGLDFINDMRPVQFTWNRRDGSMGAKPDIGFIAQELYETELDHSSSSRTRLVNWSDPNKLEADYVRSYPILVKAVQELSAKCNALEARLAALEGA